MPRARKPPGAASDLRRAVRRATTRRAEAVRRLRRLWARGVAGGIGAGAGDIPSLTLATVVAGALVIFVTAFSVGLLCGWLGQQREPVMRRVFVSLLRRHHILLRQGARALGRFPQSPSLRRTQGYRSSSARSAPTGVWP